MKNFIISITVIVFWSVIVSSQSSACDGKYKVTNVRSPDQLTVRSGPGQNYKSVAWLHHNESCIVKTSDCQGQWCRIEFGTIKGWVHTYYLKPARKLQ